jgi:hypothetical protein
MTGPASGDRDRDRDAAGRARNARQRDALGRPLPQRDVAPVADDPAELPDDALRHAQALLDAGRAFEAHEVLEAVWKATVGSERELWRGLAQLAVGITHALRGNRTGAASLLQRAAETMAPFRHSPPHGVNVDGLCRWSEAASRDLALTTAAPRLVAPTSPPGAGSGSVSGSE